MWTSTFANKMKKPIVIFGSLLIIGLIVYVVPRLYATSSARPLEGIFDVGMECMGGHEVFLELSGSEAFDNCPGHRERKMRAKVIRDNKTATIIDPRDDQPWIRIEWDGSGHSMEFLKRPDSQSVFGMFPARGEIDQVTNPWRLWIPRLLPEE